MTQGKLPEQEERIFLSLCGQHDRELLTGKIEMRLPEFERITYITMAFGYTSYTMELQERYIELTQKLNEQLDQENEILSIIGSERPAVVDFVLSCYDQKRRKMPAYIADVISKYLEENVS